MSETTNLKLFKHDNPSTNTNQFDVEKALNENWDKIDEAVGKNKTDIETNKTNINKLQEEQITQDTLIQDLQAENNLLKSQIPTGQVGPSEYITIKDSANMPFKEISIGGNDYQETREGYNKLSNNATTQTINGVTITKNKDNSVTLNGTSTEAFSITYSTEEKTLNGDYIFYLYGKNSKINLQGKINNSTVTFLSSTSTAEYIAKSYTENNILTSVYSYINANTTFDNETFKPMITEGTEIKEYQQHGAMPSPDYPSPVRVCGDNVQLFDYDKFSLLPDENIGNAKEFTYRTKDIVCKYVSDFEENTSYAISGVASSNVGNGSTVVVYTDGTYTEVFSCWTNSTFNKKIDFISDSSKTISHINFVTYANTTFTLKDFKLCKGTSTGGYSKHGQGSITFKKNNGNLAKFNEDYFEVTEESIKNIKGINGIKIINNIKLRKGQTIKTRLKLLSKNSVTFTAYKVENGASEELGVLNYVSLSNYDLNTNYDKSYTATEDCEITYRAWGNSDSASFEFQFTASIDTPIDYIKSESKEYIVPTQQPLLDEDYLDLDNEEQVHTYSQYIFTGEEDGWSRLNTGTTDSYRFRTPNLNALIVSDASKVEKLYSNIATATSANNTWNNVEDGICYGTDNKLLIFINSMKNMTLDEFKAKLKELYNAGTPAYVWYKTATKTRLPFTDEQKTVAKQIKTDNNYKNVTIMYSEDEIEPIISGVYYKDRETTDKNYEDRIAALEAAIIS